MNCSVRSYFISLIILISFLLTNGQFEPDQPCFCKTAEAVDNCSIDEFSNHKVYPLLQELLRKDFFRFYKVNMEKTCPFWPDDRQCVSKECGIGYCDDEVPLELKRPASISVHRLAPNRTLVMSGNSQDKTCQESSNAFDPLDTTLTEGHREQLRDMDWHDDNENKFCAYDDENPDDMHYVDLSRNPERYTGYKGDSAQRVWRSIYSENCFKPDMKFDKNFLVHPNTVGLCFEKRVFYRLISGLHSAITISIAANNFSPDPTGFGPGKWFRNVEMFRGRFGTTWTKDGPERLKNVYFVYLLELRALVKATPYLRNELFYTGNPKEDVETRAAIDELMDTLKQFPDQFDETEMFTGNEAQARELREEFRSHFLNVSRIMDCVGCDKCRLWGKLQAHGIGTALKILFADLPTSHYRNGKTHLHPSFQLTRNEVVSLFQSFGRFSSAIKEVDEFRRLLS
ncbi:unnamed protein product [Enterobius vermicularis]|uniref:Endoplasmic oxidoreductin-1 n=1 Tax=Enterobius vermicularis TaxID=51028 RepID=A0A158QA53_ENTVE|nr:unnamed protein product [Enterobius vermicularis]